MNMNIRLNKAVLQTLSLITISSDVFRGPAKRSVSMMLNSKKNKTALKLLIFLSLVTGFTSSLCANELFTLKNLERERAILISEFLNKNLDVQKKHERMQQRQRQLADMERMVLRDERLLNTKSNMVVRAFKHYDRTFLVHAGAENNVNAMNQWLHNIKLTNRSVLNAKAGYR
jgi:hypothetical protein